MGSCFSGGKSELYRENGLGGSKEIAHRKDYRYEDIYEIILKTYEDNGPNNLLKKNRISEK